MIGKGETVGVALSGGKDSVALLDLMLQLRGRRHIRVVALHVDMGLGEYSTRQRAACQRIAAAHGVRLEVEQVAAHGIRVRPLGDWPMCAVCGGVRRALLPRLGRRIGVDVVCTGHTMDDELQAILKNLLSGKPEASSPVLPGTPSMPRKAKPLYFVPERVTALYVELKGLEFFSDPCPEFTEEAHRLKRVWDLLEELAPMGKVQVLHGMRRALTGKPGYKPEHPCPECGEPTTMRVCPICRLKQ